MRCFDDPNIVHVANKIDPAGDIEVINTELALADLDSLERGFNASKNVLKGGDKDAKFEVEVLKKCASIR